MIQMFKTTLEKAKAFKMISTRLKYVACFLAAVIFIAFYRSVIMSINLDKQGRNKMTGL